MNSHQNTKSQRNTKKETKNMKLYQINDKLDFATIKNILHEDGRIALSEEAEQRINKCRQYLDKKIKSSDAPFYGINTGFGALHNVKIAAKDYSKLQTNLIRSHACGAGEEVPKEIVR